MEESSNSFADRLTGLVSWWAGLSKMARIIIAVLILGGVASALTGGTGSACKCVEIYDNYYYDLGSTGSGKMSDVKKMRKCHEKYGVGTGSAYDRVKRACDNSR